MHSVITTRTAVVCIVALCVVLSSTVGAPQPEAVPPLVLTIDAPASDGRHPSGLAVACRLTNRSDRPVHGCFVERTISFPDAPTKATISANLSGGPCMAGTEFLLPASAALVWVESRDMPGWNESGRLVQVTFRVMNLEVSSNQRPTVWGVSSNPVKLDTQETSPR